MDFGFAQISAHNVRRFYAATRLELISLDQLITLRMNHTKFEESGPLERSDRFLLFGRRKAGKLDQNGITTLRLNQRFGDAESVHPPAQHFDRLRQSGGGVGGVGEPAGIHLHQEGGASLQIQAQADAPGGGPLEPVQDKCRRVLLGLRIKEGEIARDVVRPDGLLQVFIGFVRRDLAQSHGFLDDGGEIRVPADCLFAKNEHQVARFGRVELEQRPQDHRHHQH